MQVLATTHPPIEEVWGRGQTTVSNVVHCVALRKPGRSSGRQSKLEPGSQPESALPVDDDDWLEQIEKQFGGNK